MRANRYLLLSTACKCKSKRLSRVSHAPSTWTQQHKWWLMLARRACVYLCWLHRNALSEAMWPLQRGESKTTRPSLITLTHVTSPLSIARPPLFLLCLCSTSLRNLCDHIRFVCLGKGTIKSDDLRCDPPQPDQRWTTITARLRLAQRTLAQRLHQPSNHGQSWTASKALLSYRRCPSLMFRTSCNPMSPNKGNHIKSSSSSSSLRRPLLSGMANTVILPKLQSSRRHAQ